MVVKAVCELACKQVLVSIYQRSIASKALKGFCWFLFIFNGTLLNFLQFLIIFDRKTPFLFAYVQNLLYLCTRFRKATDYIYSSFFLYHQIFFHFFRLFVHFFAICIHFFGAKAAFLHNYALFSFSAQSRILSVKEGCRGCNGVG